MIINQHRIPKFLLKKWGENFVYVSLVDKYIKYEYPSKATTVDFFYEHESKDLNEIEKKLSVIESKASKIIKELLDKTKLELLPKELNILIKFFDVQSIRVRNEENKIEIIESFYDEKMKDLYDKSKFGIVERIEEVLKFNYCNELNDYRKWKRNIPKKKIIK